MTYRLAHHTGAHTIRGAHRAPRRNPVRLIIVAAFGAIAIGAPMVHAHTDHGNVCAPGTFAHDFATTHGTPCVSAGK